MTENPSRLIAFQGVPGAYSNMACLSAYPDMTPLPCETFDDTFAAVSEGRAALAMIPIENSVAGRVADIHHLLPDSGLHVVAEHFQRVNHQLLATKGTSLAAIKRVYSHIHALAQCRDLIRELGLEPHAVADTAGAAADIAARGDTDAAAVASTLAARIYDLQVLRSDVEDAAHNTTRFVIMASDPIDPDPDQGPVMTTFVFEVRNIPASLYKALGGFATNGVNMIKLESYMLEDSFTATQFFAEVEGHPNQKAVRLAFEELGFFSRSVRILGVYPAHPFRERGEIALGH
ncbi:MAG: prephenate dehydratase [Alphaproteobacteria bacterium]|jgi:prephenate dehydratase|nr:prephenate dehydratase [Alphaproteobacteria bacterium]MDP6515918.1 prephenate dehydratase [Alphaproteobacteria bacterium]